MPAWPIWSDAYLPFLAGQWDILHGWPADDLETCINVNLNSSWCIWMHLMHWDEKDQWVSGGWGLKDDSARLEDCSLHSKRRGNHCAAQVSLQCIISIMFGIWIWCYNDHFQHYWKTRRLGPLQGRLLAGGPLHPSQKYNLPYLRNTASGEVTQIFCHQEINKNSQKNHQKSKKNHRRIQKQSPK